MFNTALSGSACMDPAEQQAHGNTVVVHHGSTAIVFLCDSMSCIAVSLGLLNACLRAGRCVRSQFGIL